MPGGGGVWCRGGGVCSRGGVVSGGVWSGPGEGASQHALRQTPLWTDTRL